MGIKYCALSISCGTANKYLHTLQLADLADCGFQGLESTVLPQSEKTTDCHEWEGLHPKPLAFIPDK
jgi:hypothetical protein